MSFISLKLLRYCCKSRRKLLQRGTGDVLSLRDSHRKKETKLHGAVISVMDEAKNCLENQMMHTVNDLINARL